MRSSRALLESLIFSCARRSEFSPGLRHAAGLQDAVQCGLQDSRYLAIASGDEVLEDVSDESRKASIYHSLAYRKPISYEHVKIISTDNAHDS